MSSNVRTFQDLVAEAKTRIEEVAAEQVKQRLDAGDDSFVLIDCREDREWEAGHLPRAVHLGRGIIDRDLPKVVPDPEREIVIYCGSGARSAMAADHLRQMGYRNVKSMAGGITGWTRAGYPVER